MYLCVCKELAAGTQTKPGLKVLAGPYLHSDEHLLQVAGKVLHVQDLLFQPAHVLVNLVLSSSGRRDRQLGPSLLQSRLLRDGCAQTWATGEEPEDSMKEGLRPTHPGTFQGLAEWGHLMLPMLLGHHC